MPPTRQIERQRVPRGSPPMLDRLSDLEERYEELTQQLASPEHASDPSALASLGRELSRLEPVVSTIRAVRELQAEQAATRSSPPIPTRRYAPWLTRSWSASRRTA